MLFALIWKEWLKLRPAFLVLFATHAAMTGWAVARLRGQFAGAHPETLWYQAAILGDLYFDMLRHLPWITGLILAVAQHLPEIQGKRLRLTLHLPVAAETSMACALGFGSLAFCLLATLDTAVIGVAGALRYPVEITVAHLWAMGAMEASGLAAYLGATFVLFEPTPRRRLHTLVLTIMAVGLFLIPARPGAWHSPLALGLGALVLAALAVAPYLAISRQRLTGKNQ